MIQNFLAAARSTTKQFAKVSLLGVAWLATAACGVQDGALEPATSLLQRETELVVWENVAAGKTVTPSGTVYNSPQFVTDSVFAPEATSWDHPQYATLIPAGSMLQVDLGKYYTINQLVVQADNNDSYAVDGLILGTWTRLADVVPHGWWGLSTRPAITISPAGSTRFLRIYATSGDGSYSVSEFQAFANVYYPDPSTNCCCTGTCGSGVMCPDVQCPQ